MADGFINIFEDTVPKEPIATMFFSDIKSETMYYDGVGIGVIIALVILIPIFCCLFMCLRLNNLYTRKINDLRAKFNAAGVVA